MNIKQGTFEFSRPANTTAYGADEVVSDGASIPVSFGTGANALIVGAQYMIKSILLCSNSSGTTNASFDLYLYTSGVTSAVVDNAPFNVSFADRHARIGKTSFTLTNLSGNSDSKEDVNIDINLPFIATESKIYGVLVATSAYTPANAEKFYGKVEILVVNA